MLAKGDAMLHFFSRAATIIWLSFLVACASVEPKPKAVAVLQYQHVANAHQIQFTNPIKLSAALYPVNFLVPADAQGFWAIFVLCNVHVTQHAMRGFHHNVNNFRVDYDGQTFGSLQPYTLRYQGTADLNTPTDTGPILDAIAAEIDEGPPEQIFQRGYYADLHYRFAIFVPKALANYSGEQLQLRYEGQPVVLAGNGYPPSDLPAVGGTGMGVAAACLPQD